MDVVCAGATRNSNIGHHKAGLGWLCLDGGVGGMVG